MLNMLCYYYYYNVIFIHCFCLHLAGRFAFTISRVSASRCGDIENRMMLDVGGVFLAWAI